MITTTTKRTGAIVTLCFIVSALATAVVYWYSFELESSLREKKGEIALFEAQKNNVVEANEMASLAQEDLVMLETVVLTEDDAITFLSELENAVRNAGVDFTTESLTVSEDAAVPSIAFRFTMAGNEALVEAQVARLETFPQASWFESLSWSRDEEGATVEIILHVMLDTQV